MCFLPHSRILTVLPLEPYMGKLPKWTMFPGQFSEPKKWSHLTSEIYVKIKVIFFSDVWQILHGLVPT